MEKAMTALCIDAQNLSKTYRSGLIRKKRFEALSVLNMALSEGEILAFLGPNGAGKTTTINLLMGFLQPSAGTVKLFGMDPEDRRVRAKLGYLPENYAFYPYMTAAKILNYFADLLKLTKVERGERIESLLVQLDLWDARNRSIGSYSRGMKQRLGIIQALLNRPSLLILDEPTSGFDPTGRKMVRNLLLDLKRSGTSILLSSHILSEVESLCDRVVIINKGRTVRQGTLGEILGKKTYEVRYQDDQHLVAEKMTALGLEPVINNAFNSVLGLDAETAQKVIRLIVESGAKLEALIPKVETLEDVFLETVDSGKTIAVTDKTGVSA
jgi:ABC-2 type transport system ATP-binding protein